MDVLLAISVMSPEEKVISLLSRAVHVYAFVSPVVYVSVAYIVLKSTQNFEAVFWGFSLQYMFESVLALVFSAVVRKKIDSYSPTAISSK